MNKIMCHVNYSHLTLNKANVSDTEASFLDLHLSISDAFVKTRFMVKEIILILIL